MNINDYTAEIQRRMLIAAFTEILKELTAGDVDEEAINGHAELFDGPLSALESYDYFGTEGLYHHAGLD